MTAPQTVADVLDAAADLLEKPGAWGQGNYQPRSGCLCTLGAISMVAVGHVPAAWGSSSARLATAAAKTLFPSLSGVANWNDEEGRTQSEVVAALRAAATSARQGETK